eukprot:3842268-Lingulodinium_polyedra.AAC.1
MSGPFETLCIKRAANRGSRLPSGFCPLVPAKALRLAPVFPGRPCPPPPIVRFAVALRFQSDRTAARSGWRQAPAA